MRPIAQLPQIDGVVRPVLVDPGAETSGAHRERHLGRASAHLADRNKCLARNNKSSDGREATNVSNGSNAIMTDDWKGNHRGFQDHREKKRLMEATGVHFGRSAHIRHTSRSFLCSHLRAEESITMPLPRSHSFNDLRLLGIAVRISAVQNNVSADRPAVIVSSRPRRRRRVKRADAITMFSSRWCWLFGGGSPALLVTTELDLVRREGCYSDRRRPPLRRTIRVTPTGGDAATPSGSPAPGWPPTSTEPATHDEQLPTPANETGLPSLRKQGILGGSGPSGQSQHGCA